jgi:hypothetical protein
MTNDQAQKIGHYISLAREHWREFRPRTYHAMQRAGALEQALQDAAESSAREMAELIAAGLTDAEAWPMVSEEYIILPEESAAPSKRAVSLLGNLKAAARGEFD